MPDPSLGWAAISWIEHYLLHGPGDVQGQPIDLDDEFAAFVIKCYRLDGKTGARRTRRAFLSRSKGRSKSGLAAMVECFEAIGPCRFDHWAEAGEVSEWGYEYEEGEPVGAPLGYVEILNVATEESQAGNTYDAVVYMLHADTCAEALLEDFGKLDVGLTRINLPNKRGFIEPVTAANESKDGGKSTFIVADETHLWTPPASGKFKLGKMHQTMVRNLLKRKVASGWMLETSTMYAEGERSVAEGTHAYATQLATSKRTDGKLLFDHRQASDHWDIEKRGERLKALREAYGPAASWMDLDAIADYWDDPQASHAEFRRFWLNQPVPLVAAKKAFIMPNWPACATSDPAPKPAALGVGVDLDRVWASLGASSAGEKPHLGSILRVRLAQQRELFVSEAARISREHGVPVALVAKGPAGTLEQELRDAGADVRTITHDEYVQSCADLYDAVESLGVSHGAYADLDAAVEAAAWNAGTRRTWSWKTGDVSALEAVTVAMKAARNELAGSGFNVW